MAKIIALWICFAIIIGCTSDDRQSSQTPTFPPPDPIYSVDNPYEWQIASPESQGLDPQILSSSLDKANNMAFMYSILVVRNGFLVAERYFKGLNSHNAYHIHSASKSYTSALVGIALREKYLENLNQKMMDFFPEYASSSLDPRKYDITLRHLLMMRAGFNWNDTEQQWREYSSSPDWVKYAIDLSLKDTPGEKFHYSTVQTNLLSAILTRASGMSTLELAEKFLFDQLQISVGYWHQDPQGNYTGGHAMWYAPRDMARFGYLFLNNGLLEGNQIIPAEWVEESVKNYCYTHLNWWPYLANSGYGYQWWTNTIDDYHVFYASGKGGQRILMIPDLKMVVVTTTDAASWQTNLSQNQAVMELIDQILDSVK